MKRKMKKIVSLVLVFAMSVAIAVPGFAAENNVQIVDRANNSNARSNNYYQETGQINLEDLEITKSENGLSIETKGDLSRAKESKKELEKQLTGNKELSNTLKFMVKNNQTPVAIGYTTINLKEVTDEQGKHLEPMTVADMAPQASGSTTKKGLLTLYTAAYLSTSGSTKYVDAYSIAHWSSGVGTPSDVPYYYDDFITLSLPSQYILTDSGMTGDLSTSYKHEEDYSTVVYGYLADNGVSVASDPQLWAYGQSTSATSSKKFVSKYVHTWATITPSFSITPAGVSISLGGTASWQIASSLTISC
jgi:hypothetical protein